VISTGALRRERPEPVLVIAAAVVIAAGVGALVAVSPVIGFGVTLGTVALVLLFLRPSRIPRVFLGALGVICIAYALGDRGIAYVGFGQLFMGEMVLALGIVSILLALPKIRFGLLDVALVGFILLGAARTIPYIGQYGVDALRDGVSWGYAVFAIAVAATFRAEWFPLLVRAYRLLIPVMLVWFPLAVVLDVVAGSALPHWPGAPVPIIFLKEGDAAVHLAAIGSFVLVGLYTSGARLVRTGVVWALWFGNLAVMGAISRGGMFAAILGAGSSVLFVRSTARMLQGAAIALSFFVALYLVNPSVELGYAGRPVSFTQLVSNAVSVLDDTSTAPDSTKAWRLAWWNKIVGYTFEGPYFWTGKGFGINLADSDGFQVNSDGSLRSPHNGNLTMLARGGVPMLGLWLLIQASFLFGMVRAGVRAKRWHPAMLPVIAVLFAYWLGAFINMSFDVYLEGPQGGIPFWAAIGLGLVAMRTVREPAAEREPMPVPVPLALSSPVPALVTPAASPAGGGARSVSLPEPEGRPEPGTRPGSARRPRRAPAT
jgi:hypothetical protein